MSKTHIFIALLVSFAAGFVAHILIGQTSKSQQEDISSFEQCQQLDQAKTNLMQISQHEYLQYTQIKDLKEKYEKADELLGKVMLLFLADVGFRMQKTEPPVAAACDPIPAHVNTVNTTDKFSQESWPATQAAVTATSAIALVNKSALVRTLDSQEKIQQFLSENLIENPKKEFADYNPLTARQIQLLEGIYSGEINFFDKKKSPYTIFWNLFPEKNGEGRYELRIEGDGTNNVTSGKGQFKNISTLSTDKNAFIIEACGDSCYMQLYYNAPFNQFFGSYYEKKGNDRKFARTGLITLHK